MNIENISRGKMFGNGEWVKGFLVKRPSAIHIGDYSPWYIEVPPKDPDDKHGSFNVDPATVGRCAPIPDNIGKAMFEGDIIRMHGNPKDLAVVEFGEFSCVSIDPEELVDKVFGWHYRPLPTDELSQLEPFCWEFQINEMWVKENDIRVIGNIHDNPELLEGGRH